MYQTRPGNAQRYIYIYCLYITINSSVCFLDRSTFIRLASKWFGSIVRQLSLYIQVAHKLVFGYGHLTWEWQEGLRSYLHPLIFAFLFNVSTL